MTKLIFRSKTLSVIRRQIFLFSLCVIKRIGICNGGIVVTKGYFWYYMKFRQFLIVLMTFYRNKMKTHFLHLKRFLQFAVFFVCGPQFWPPYYSFHMWCGLKTNCQLMKISENGVFSKGLDWNWIVPSSIVLIFSNPKSKTKACWKDSSLLDPVFRGIAVLLTEEFIHPLTALVFVLLEFHRPGAGEGAVLVTDQLATQGLNSVFSFS